MIPLWLPVSLNQMLKIIKNQQVEFGVGLMMINDGIEFPDGRFVDNYSFDNLIIQFLDLDIVLKAKVENGFIEQGTRQFIGVLNLEGTS